MNFMHILDPIINVLEPVLMWLTHTLHSYGLAIIIFTILVRGALAPLNLRQLKSAKKMSAMGPRIKELQQRHKGDREALTREQMALYKEEGVNPAAGCLPLLLQMPILYSLFFIFQNLKNRPDLIYHAHFLWFHLDKPDGLFGHFFIGSANAAWGPLPILAAGTQWVQQRMMMQPTSDPQQRSTQQIMQFMPLMIMFFAINYPAGLALYWVTSTTFSIVMQYFITGWGQLFKSPFKIPEAPVATAAAGATADPRRRAVAAPRANGTSGTRTNGNGRRATVFSAAPPTRTVEDGDGRVIEGQVIAGEDGAGARQGKMQRTVTRQRPRPSKGARR